jgi:hypothetical protein
MGRSISAFLSDRSLIEAWLLSEKSEIEAKGAQLSHWGRGQQVGIVITARNKSGEMHVAANGDVSRRVEGPDKKIILSGSATVSDENGFKVLYQEFREKVLSQ